MKKIITVLMTFLMVACSSGTTTPSEVSDTTGSIHVYTRDASSGTREAFEKAISLEELTQTAIEVTSNGDMATKVGADEMSIGYVSLSTDFVANGIVALSFEGIFPSIETVLNGTYGMQRPFSYVTRTAGDFESTEKEALVAAFLDFLCNSIEGQLVVSAAGGIVDETTGVAWAILAENHPIVNQDNSSITITTAGSTSVSKSVQAALEMFQPMAGNFQFVMNQTGSSDGYKRVLGEEKDGANAADIGFASREFKSEEDVMTALSSGVYCIDAVVAVVNEKSPVTNLSQDQLMRIFSGEITTLEALQ